MRLGLGAMTGLYTTLQFRAERMRAAADSPYAAATDLAEFLVRAGVPFRDAHAIVGALVRESLDDGVPLAELVAGSRPWAPAAATPRTGRVGAPAHDARRRRTCRGRRAAPPSGGRGAA